ncbi:hypothetical protein E6C70_10745 [Glaciibacter flavus]|uniref:Uncharacterized protein n=1 Tax=Orlajensenia flava TaxID=2565934 RepID=A0A4S4FT39_9MICO|nr:hypothetical protein [Glaciibacter flavus]THG33909.1 hypothetical protein E6C70_10745 [Glaciibacter flavus]
MERSDATCDNRQRGPEDLMQSLSSQLQRFAEQARQTEDVIAAARDHDREVLIAHRDRLRNSWDSVANAASQHIDADDAAWQFRWAQLRERVRGQFAELQDRVEQRDAERDASANERDARRAERDASEALGFAVLAVDGAMAAIIDAELARAAADAANAGVER